MTNDPTRNKDLKRIHTYKNLLGLDDETYRDMLKCLTGKTSSADMDYKQRWRVIQEMSKRLPHDKRPVAPPKKGYPQRPAVIDHKEPLIGKIEALLTESNKPWAYAHAIAKKMFSIDLVEWCDCEQLHKIVAALVYNQKRERAKVAKAAAVAT